ncbi:uncharacterized protein LOC132723688 [Ruditapes philippinarum]|uniref:uncharacterized protein LOC132723688 n=1 Tax=Ruditapes philippinarum TaxID=129788 RepID=UPI00295BD2AE|nr:uncharacterized protein LOC132723688 [Ruditapes philippinarum]
MEDDVEIGNKLRQYPSSFDLYEDIKSMSKDCDCLKKHMERLVNEVESNPYDNTMEKLRAWNFISFLSFILGNKKDAFKYNSKVLERSKYNIIGLCNKAWFLLKMQENYNVVHDLCNQLNESIKNKSNMLFAKAEKAFCYLCFGTERNEKSRHLFKDVLSEIHEQNIDFSGETDGSENMLTQTDNNCVLNFSYALTYKRALNLTKTHDASLFDVSTQLDMIKKVCNIYSDILHFEGDSSCLKHYQGRSYVELGLIDDYIGKNKSGFETVNGIKDFLSDRDIWLSTNEFFEKAESFCPNDVFVLERCGTYFRDIHDTGKSISLLEKAIKIRETSYSHHHLALSFKQQMEPDDTDVSAMLKQTSLDIGKETLSAVSNMSVEDHDKKTHMELKEQNASANSDDGNVSSKVETFRGRLSGNQPDLRSRDNVSFKRETDTRCHNENLRCWGSRGGVSFREPLADHQLGSRNRGNSPFKTEIMRECNSENQQGWGSSGPLGNCNEGNVEGISDSGSSYTARFGIKCPKEPKLINKEKHKDTIKQIIFHLDKSFELSNNCEAIYDKGLLYRQIKEYDKALATFKTLIRNEGGHCSLVQLSNAYEQAGLCLYDMLFKEKNKVYEVDMKTYFKKSIEISCWIVSKIPFLKECWVSAPTLKEFISGKAKTVEQLKDLFFLSKKFENYSEAIEVLKDLKELSSDENEKVKLDIQLVESYLRSGNYDDAVLALDAIVCLQNGYALVDEKMYLQAHIEGGIVAWKQKTFEVAGLRLRNALDFYRHHQNVHDNECHKNDTDKEDENFDVFILCNEKIQEKSMSLKQILTAFKLRVTINFQDLLPGTPKMTGICQQFRHSKHFLLVIDEIPLDRIDYHYFEMMQEVVLNRNYGHIVIVKTCNDAKIPFHLSKYPSMEMNVQAGEVLENESLCETIKALLFKLASSK